MSNGQTQSSAISPSLPSIQERDDLNGGSEGGVSSPTDVDQRTARFLPTEYGRSFQTGLNPRPRNTVGGWQARNISNIIPITGSEGAARQRPSRRPAPLIIQNARSQVFPEAVVVTHRGRKDANNNPETPVPPVPMVRGRLAWPWQTRAQNSSIFTGDSATASSPRAQTGVSRWPWQERARRSAIFDLLNSKEVVTPSARPRSYQWDQRKTTLNISNVGDNLPKVGPPAPTHGKQWPWKERARQSIIFLSPDKPHASHQIKYIWDQRRCRLSMQLDPEAKCPKGSHYNENFPKWQRVQDDSIKPAGKPCYYDDDGEGGNESRRRMSPPRNEGKKKVREGIIALPATQKNSVSPLTKSKVEGTTCLEIVPVDFKFN